MKHLTIDRRLPEKLWKKFIDNKQTIITAVVMFLIPILSCVIKIWTDGMSLTDIKIAAMTTNDEAFYFKYVEGVVNYGHPMGFFGYNESRALIGGGLAWSPLIMVHWIVWGFLFGWNYLSPILCNIAIMCVAFVILAVWVKPTYLQTLLIVIFNLLYSQSAFYSLSTSPENFIYALMIIFISLVYKMRKEEQTWPIYVMFGIATYLVCIRPYYLVLLIVPSYFLYKKNRIIACVVGGVISALSSVAYAFIAKYLCTPLASGNSVVGGGLSKFNFDEGTIEGIKKVIKTFIKGIEMTFHWISVTFNEGNYQGRMLLVIFGVFFFLIVLAVKSKNKKEKFMWLCYWMFYFVVRYCAVILLYSERITDYAVRHMLDFIVVGVIIIAVESSSKPSTYIMNGIMCLLLIVTQYYVPKLNPQPGITEINYMDEETYADILDLRDGIDDYIKIAEGEISYDNTVIWLFGDDRDGEWTLTDWRYFFALPEGIGINICYKDYFLYNFDNLKCQYLMTVSGGEIANFCKEKGALEIYNNGIVTLYNIKDLAVEILTTNDAVEYVTAEEETPSILVLGDSIFGLYRNQFGICKQLQQMLGANVYNAAVGGTSAAWREGVSFPHQAYSFAMLSDCILQDNYAYLEHNVDEIEAEKIRYIHEPIILLKSMNYDELDYILICYGTNDYFSKIPIESNWPQSNESYKNALNNGISKIKQKCPNVDIILCSPMYGNYESNEVLSGDSNTLDMGYGTLQDYMTAMKEVAEEQEVIFVDAYNELEINKDNWEMYSRDGVHPSYRGSKLYAELIAKIIKSLSDV